jgi:hypothetical protein
VAIALVLATPVAQRLLEHAQALGQLAGLRPARNICTARRNSSGYAGRVFGTLDTILSRPAGATGQVSVKGENP